MNLKVPGAILPLGCAILSTRAITVRGGWYNPPLGELGLKLFTQLCGLSISKSIIDSALEYLFRYNNGLNAKKWAYFQSESSSSIKVRIFGMCKLKGII